MQQVVILACGDACVNCLGRPLAGARTAQFALHLPSLGSNHQVDSTVGHAPEDFEPRMRKRCWQHEVISHTEKHFRVADLPQITNF